MHDSPQDILRAVARMPEANRHAQKAELLKLHVPQLTTPLHRQILECLVGEPCTSVAAKSWAATLIREEASGGSTEP